MVSDLNIFSQKWSTIAAGGEKLRFFFNKFCLTRRIFFGIGARDALSPKFGIFR